MSCKYAEYYQHANIFCDTVQLPVYFCFLLKNGFSCITFFSTTDGLIFGYDNLLNISYEIYFETVNIYTVADLQMIVPGYYHFSGKRYNCQK